MTGRRVATVQAVELAGDYCLTGTPGTRALWFRLPNEPATMRRIAEPTWTLTEGPDGAVTAHPSIHALATDGVSTVWHGWLVGGEWRD